MDVKSGLTFTFCGDYEVDAKTVSQAISSLVDISTVAAERQYPDVEFRLSVRALAPGSLEFDFVAAATIVQNLFSQENINYAKSLIELISTAFSIKKFLKNQKPESIKPDGNAIVIKHPNGSQISVPKAAGIYFFDSRIDNSITNIINSAKLSNGVTGISVHGENEIKITRAEFEDCSQEIDLELQRDKIVTVRKNETLFIRQADFSGELKWRFRSDKNFAADILDKAFLNRVKTGSQTISSKTYIVADVRVTMIMGIDGVPDETGCTYEILKVHSVGIPGEGQEKFEV